MKINILLSLMLASSISVAADAPKVEDIKLIEVKQEKLSGVKLYLDGKKGNCIACHSVNDTKATGKTKDDLSSYGNIAPDLSGVTTYRSDKELFDMIYDKTKSRGDTMMPTFGRNKILTDDEINAIIDYLKSVAAQQ